MSTIQIALFCDRCGRKLHRVVDLDCPPSSVRCTCGARYALQLEQEAPRYDFGPGPDEEDALVDAGLEGVESGVAD